MDKKGALAVCLSQEELFVILAYLKIPSLMGLDTHILTSTSEERRQLALQVAERSLIARTFLVPDGNGRLKLDQTILAVTIACANPDYTLMLTRNLPDKPIEPYFFHTHRQMAVIHTIPVSGIHQFLVVKDKEALIQSALSVLAPGTQAASPGRASHLLDGYVKAAQGMARDEGQSAIQTMMVEAGLDIITAEQFAIALANPIASTTLISKHYKTKGSSSVNGFTVLQGQNGSWLLKPEGQAESGQISLQPVSSQEIIKAFRHLVNNV